MTPADRTAETGPQQRTARPEHVRRRRLLIGAAVTMIGAGWLISTHAHPTHAHPAVPAKPSPAQAAVRPSPEATIAVAPRPGRDVAWRVFAGIDLPVSQTFGPYRLTATRAAGFAHSDGGAAVAAAQLLVRTFPFAGPATFEPTIAQQVTGDDAPALARLTRQAYTAAATAAGVKGGGPIVSADGWIAGYQMTRTHAPAGVQTVHVLVASSGEDDGFTDFTVRLTWAGGDWRLIAPLWGDWSRAAAAVAAPDPYVYRSYDRLGTAGAAS